MDRLFLALPLPDGVRGAVEAGLRTALPGGLPGRVVPPENWHITLRFLGDTPPELSARLVAALGTARLPSPFAVELGRCGAFPGPSRASVLWLGVEKGHRRLAALAGELEEVVRGAGFPAEGRPYTGHLTLSRLRPPADVQALIDAVPAQRIRLDARELVLFRNAKSAGTVHYDSVARFPLD